MTLVEDRHVRIWGTENQKKLKNLKVLVSGTGILSQYVLAGLSALGFGNVVVVGNSRAKSDLNFLRFEKDILGFKKNELIVESLKKINQTVNYSSYFSKPINAILNYENPNIILECSNNSYSKELCFYYAKKNDKNIYSAGSSDKTSKLVRGENLSEMILHEYHGMKQGLITSGTIASLLLDSLRKDVFILNDEKRLTENVNYYLPKISNDFGTALIIGAGALGTFSSLGLASSNTNMIIVDSDIVEVSNLNRQILYYGMVGEYKAKTLAKRISKLNRSIKIDYLIEKVTNYNIDKLISKTDMVIGCVDNFETRAIISQASLRNKKVYIDGRTDQSEGELSTYIPFRNNCLNCRKGFSGFKQIKNSCLSNNVQPSVITTNMFIGTQMAAEALTLNLKENLSLNFSSYSKNLFMKKKDLLGETCGC